MSAIDRIQQDILDFIQLNNITHLISLGDWYDKGYKSTRRLNNDRNFDEEFNKATNGNFYMCIGNHFFLERDNNPEMYLIQPHHLYQPATPLVAFEPVIHAPDKIKIGTVQISLFHYNKQDHNNYIAARDPDTTFHIGVYHDDSVVEDDVRRKAGYWQDTPPANLQRIYENIDLAIIGHIHTPCNGVSLNIRGRKMTQLIPGAICPSRDRHTSVKLPVITIDDNSNVSCSLHTFSTHMEMLNFLNKREAVRADNVNELLTPAPFDTEEITHESLRDFLTARNFSPGALKCTDSAARDALDLPLAVSLLN
jgi:predicted phosphodiesterase